MVQAPGKYGARIVPAQYQHYTSTVKAQPDDVKMIKMIISMLKSIKRRLSKTHQKDIK